MRYAVLSVMLHAGLVGGSWLVMQLWPQPLDDMLSAESLAVDIVSVEAVTQSEPSAVVSEATQTLVSAGAEPATPMVEATPEASVAPMSTSMVPVEVETIRSAEVLVAEPLSAQPVETLAPLLADPDAASVAPAAVTADASPLERAGKIMVAALEPVIAEDQITPPIPRPRAERPKTQPTTPQREARRSPSPATPSPQRSRTASQAGNGGKDAGDSAARSSSGGQGQRDRGGSAATSKYPGLVQARVTRAARYPSRAKGAAGETRVRFTVAANGQVSGIGVASSSGNAVIDEAAVAAVVKAAPFPPIPEDAGRSSWSFTVPVMFRRQ